MAMNESIFFRKIYPDKETMTVAELLVERIVFMQIFRAAAEQASWCTKPAEHQGLLYDCTDSSITSRLAEAIKGAAPVKPERAR